MNMVARGIGAVSSELGYPSCLSRTRSMPPKAMLKTSMMQITPRGQVGDVCRRASEGRCRTDEAWPPTPAGIRLAGLKELPMLDALSPFSLALMM